MTVIEVGQNVLSSSISRSCNVYPDAASDNSSSSNSSPEPLLPSHKSSSLLNPPSSMTQNETIADSREFVCGWGAAFINITVTFPMNKLMFRQMLHGISTANALSQLKKEGLHNLYRGILPPLCQKTISTSTMFGMYEQYSRSLSHHFPSIGSGEILATAAILAGCTEALLSPFERIQTILQDKKFHGKYKNSLHCARELYKFGVPEYYRGFSLVLIRNGPSNILFFGLRKEIRDRIPCNNESWYGGVLVDFLAGAFLGAFISTVMYPINLVKTHQQTQVGGPFQTVYGTFLHVFNARGRKVRALFKGVHVNYSRALVSWGIINASYEMLLRNLYS